MGGGGGVYKEGNLGFENNWASRIVRSKFTVFALFYFLFEGNFASSSSRGRFCVTSSGGLYLEGLIHRGAYFRNLTVY